MKILQQLTIDDTTYVFTENPTEDIKAVQALYLDENRNEYMGYETPLLDEFTLLGNHYKCISFWHDNEDPRDITLKSLLT